MGVVAPKYYNTSSFKKLEGEWYKKLRDSGFEDIEYPQASSGEDATVLKGETSTHSLRKNWDWSKAEYYRLATHWCWHLTKQPRLVRDCWRMHSDGVPHRHIAKKLGVGRGWAYDTIKYQRRLMLAHYREFGDV